MSLAIGISYDLFWREGPFLEIEIVVRGIVELQAVFGQTLDDCCQPRKDMLTGDLIIERQSLILLVNYIQCQFLRGICLPGPRRTK